MADSPLSSSFKQAAKWLPRTDREITNVTVHDMEAPEGPTTAENCQSFFTTAAAGGSAHYCVDTNSVAGSVHEKDQAAHAPGANQNGIGIELCGYARQTEDEWMDEASVATMRQAAALTADICARNAIPVRWLTDQQLANGEKGLTTHAQVSRVFRKSDHTDPGPNFPADYFMRLVQLGASEEDDMTPDQSAKLDALVAAVADIQAVSHDTQAHVKSPDHGLAKIQAGIQHVVDVLGRVEVAISDPTSGVRAILSKLSPKN